MLSDMDEPREEPAGEVREELDRLRAALDRTDAEILRQLRERLDTVAEIARRKAGGLPFLRDPEREAALLARVEAEARAAGLDPFRTSEIFREIIAMSVRAQEEHLLARERDERSAKSGLCVAYQGGPGAYSHLAARKYFAGRPDLEYVGFPSFALALGAAERGEAGYTILPIENAIAGSINEIYDLLHHADLSIVGEEVFEIRHCLLALAPGPPSGLRRILSHPQALAQCSDFLGELTGCEVTSFFDTAEAVRKVREDGDPTQGAIASEEAGRLHGLTIIARDIANQEENWTRFVLVSAVRILPDPRIPAKTSLIFSAPHRQGALARCLAILAEHGLNLTKLESRRLQRRPWEYLFYLDFEGSLAQEPVVRAVAALRAECPSLKVLGSYPARTTAAGRVGRLGRSRDDPPAGG
jgi:chorismate mutase/prephenate dehydratase